MHDWTRVNAGEFHSFHNAWIAELGKALNGGLLPEGYYALGEQHASQEPDDRFKPDVLTLERHAEMFDSGESEVEGGVAVAEAPPQASITIEADLAYLYALQRRTLAIRHVSRDRPVALVEIASPGNKDRRGTSDDFVDKCTAALRAGLHLLVVDLFPPRTHDPGGLAVTVAKEAGLAEFDVPANQRIPAVSFEVGTLLRAYAEPFGLGDSIPTLPLFYKAGWYVNLPLQPAYDAAYEGVPRHLRRALEQ